MTADSIKLRSDVNVGERWRSKRESWRFVDILELRERRDGDFNVYVRRNTSRRKQPLKLSTLLKDYRRV